MIRNAAVACIALFGISLTLPPAQAQRDDTIGSVRVYVQTQLAAPIYDAEVSVSGHLSERTDRDGSVVLGARAPMQFPALMEVRAPGFQTAQLLVQGIQHEYRVVHLAAQPGRPDLRASAVSAAELAPETIRAARRLHEAGLEALASADHQRAERLLRETLA